MKSTEKFPVLNFLRQHLNNTKEPNPTHMRYPTAISQTLNFKIDEVEAQKATVSLFGDPELHGNQQGTIHGGLLCELADAAIGTAHSTTLSPEQSFTTIELKINFIRPSWKTKLSAKAEPIYSGKTITHYKSEIINEEAKLVAIVTSTVMTLIGEKAQGR